MFLLHRPTARDIEQFIDRSHSLSLSYGPTGTVRDRPATGRFDEQVVVVGHGDCFERAIVAVQN